MLKIGLTGGIGSGKTAASKCFQSLGVPIIDADEISRELVKPGLPAYKAIIDEFGSKILQVDGGIDRAKLRAIVFSDERERIKLEGILHPLIRQKINSNIADITAPYCIVCIPLLIETGQADLVDRVLLVDVTTDDQINRVMARDNASRNDVKSILRTQVDHQTRRLLADDIIDNSGDLAGLQKKVEAQHNQYMQMVGESGLVESENFVDNDAIIDNKFTNVESNMSWLKSNQNTVEKIDLSQDEIVYELPLNEKIRNLIRLESLFEEVEFHLQGKTTWDSRTAVNNFIDILNVFSRPEIKTELMKEMDRISKSLAKYNSIAGVNVGRLEQVQQELCQTAKNLRAMEGQIGQGLKQNDFVMSIRQRDSIPGGAMMMDLPSYGFWLSQSIEQRNDDIREWLSEFDLVKNAIYLVLNLIRDSATAMDAFAKSGFYQHTLDTGIANQIVRVILPAGSPYFPEISGGRHRFTVRFLKPMGFDRPVQIEHDVSFKLVCCAL